MDKKNYQEKVEDATDLEKLILSDICYNQFPNGKINASYLTKKYKVGTSICREALHRLVGKNVIFYTPNVGYSILIYDQEVPIDVLNFYNGISGFCSKQIIQNFSHSWFGDLSSCVSIFKILCMDYNEQKSEEDKSQFVEKLMKAQVDFTVKLYQNCNSTVRATVDLLEQRLVVQDMPKLLKIYSSFKWYHKHLNFLEEILTCIVKKDSDALSKAMVSERNDFIQGLYKDIVTKK